MTADVKHVGVRSAYYRCVFTIPGSVGLMTAGVRYVGGMTADVIHVGGMTAGVKHVGGMSAL